MPRRPTSSSAERLVKGIGLSVRDNGKGFDIQNKNARVKGLGLVSMQERTRLLDDFSGSIPCQRKARNLCLDSSFLGWEYEEPRVLIPMTTR
jgi:hypothetical protein